MRLYRGRRLRTEGRSGPWCCSAVAVFVLKKLILLITLGVGLGSLGIALELDIPKPKVVINKAK